MHAVELKILVVVWRRGSISEVLKRTTLVLVFEGVETLAAGQ